MSLDMYLNRRVYVYNNMVDDPKKQVKILPPETTEYRVFSIKDDFVNQSKVIYLVEEVMYWRKANFIHNWFVDNVQEGRDDCGEYYVSESNIERLVKECKEDIEYFKTAPYKEEEAEHFFNSEKHTYKIYIDVDESKLNLTTTTGFFFGNVLYDEYYLKLLVHTVEQIEPLLGKGGHFYYSSSR